MELKPQGRVFHSFTGVENGDGVLIGGLELVGQQQQFSQEYFVFSAITKNWKQLTLNQRTSSDLVFPRYGHSSAHYKDNIIFVFGGIVEDKHGEHILDQNDLYQFEYQSHKGEYSWTLITCEGERPESRKGAILSVAQQHVILFGGNNNTDCLNDFWTMDLNSVYQVFAWIKVDLQPISPTVRYGHTSVVFKNQQSSEVLIFGGKEGDDVYNDYFILNFQAQKQKWVLDKYLYKNKLTPRAYSNSCIQENVLINLGGITNNKEFCKTIQLLSLQDETQHLVLPLPYGIQQCGSFCYKNELYIFGGEAQQNLGVPLELLNIDLDDHLKSLSKSQSIEEESQKNYIEPSLSPLAKKNKEIQIPKVEQQEQKKKIENWLNPEKQTSFKMDLSVKQSYTSHNPEIGNSVEVRRNSLRPYRKQDEHDLTKFHENPDTVHNILINEMLQPSVYRKSAIQFSYPQTAVLDLIETAIKIIQNDKTIIDIYGPVQIFGDLYGQYNDIMRHFHYHGSPFIDGQNDDILQNSYLFLGNYVDRGRNSLDVLILLLSLKIRYPNQVFLLRGNHEDRNVNKNYGFLNEIEERLDFKDALNDPNSCYNRFNDLFDHLPFAAVVEKKIFCCHGGIGPQVIENYESIAKIQRPIQMTTPDKQKQQQKILHELLWSEPTNVQQGQKNQGKDTEMVQYFGKDRLNEFLIKNSFSHLIRGNTCVQKGFQQFHGGLGFTVFSVTRYCLGDNSAAFLEVDQTDSKLLLIPKIITPKQNSTWNQEVIQKFPENTIKNTSLSTKLNVFFKKK